MNYEEFFKEEAPQSESEILTEGEQKTGEETDEAVIEEEPVESLDVQRAVVEALAADKAEIEETVLKLKEKISSLEEEKKALMAAKEDLEKNSAALAAEKDLMKAELERVKSALAESLAKEYDMQERNPNALALLDRDVELPDRFPGETRDHVLEVIAEARAVAEKEGRLRRAQVLEGVLTANEPNGNLSKKRAALTKFFEDNNNLVTGPVIAELKRCGIAHKNGEDYLLPSEILTRTY